MRIRGAVLLVLALTLPFILRYIDMTMVLLIIGGLLLAEHLPPCQV